jgi:hypothetical protein
MKMLKKNQIRSSDSPYKSPTILDTKKPSGGFWMCIDYHQLNKVLDPYVFKMPNKEQIFPQMNSYTLYCKINSANVYHKIGSMKTV